MRTATSCPGPQPTPRRSAGSPCSSAGPGRTYYAQPTNGSMSPPSRSDIDAVVRRQRELGVPQEFEWVHETSPLLGGIARDAGLSVRELPLMTLRAPGFAAVPNGYRIRVLPADDPSVPAALAAIGVAF